MHLDGGCHASEVAGAQMMPLLAYDLVAGAETPRIKDILANDIVMLWPTMNPDGQQMVAEWLAKNAGTPYANSGLPRLYQEYVGHDNNRDAYMINMIESRVLEHVWRQWEPNIVYVLHQTSPFPTRIWLPPFSEPVGLEAPAIVSREVNMIGMAIAQGLDERGQVGATHMGTSFDAWYPGYVDYAPVFKNIPAFWTETAGNGAAAREYTANDMPAAFKDLRPQSLYSSPWPAGWWRLADAVAYDETAAIATLEYAAKYKESLLYNRYQAGRDQIARGRTAAPYAYFIPRDQRDPVAAVEMLRRLAFAGVRVSQLTAPVTIGAVTYPADTWVVPTDQEFAAMAREVLDVQKYPDLRQYPGGPPLRPYDAAGWTLPLQMGVRVGYATAPLTDDGAVEDAPARADAGAEGDARRRTTRRPRPMPPRSTACRASGSTPTRRPPRSCRRPAASPAAARRWPSTRRRTTPIARSTARGRRAPRRVRRGHRRAPARASSSRALPDAAQQEMVSSLALVAERTTASGAPLKRPRVGLFQPWSGSMDEGWTRWVLEQYGFDIVTLHPEDFKAPIGTKVDVLILADDARLPVEGSGGRAAGAGGRAGAPAGATPPAGAMPPAGGAPPAARPDGRAGQPGGGRGGGRGPCGPSTPTRSPRPICSCSTHSSARAARSSASTARAGGPCSSSSCP